MAVVPECKSRHRLGLIPITVQRGIVNLVNRFSALARWRYVYDMESNG